MLNLIILHLQTPTMKNIILLLVLILASYATFAQQCRAITAKKTQCSRKAVKDSLCTQHYKLKHKIVAVQYLKTENGYAYTKEIYADHSEVIAIGLNLYPHWQKADSEAGINSRGTSTWTKIAKK